MFALAYANMRFHRDGRSNLYVGSSLLKDKLVVEKNRTTGSDISLYEVLKVKEPEIGMINPPYSVDKGTSSKVKEDKKGKSELDFILSMLEYLKKGGIGIAIVPLSTASGKKGEKLRKDLMSKHTLLSVMTMPSTLFQDSKVSTHTCIMVFKAHIPHNSSSKVFLGNWKEDGFRVIPHRGRLDVDGKWSIIRLQWLNMLDGTIASDRSNYILKHLKPTDEWVVEAYGIADYSKITDDDFKSAILEYSLSKYNDKKGEHKSKIYQEDIDVEGMKLNMEDWKDYNIIGKEGLFTYEVGKTSVEDSDDVFEYPLISATSENNGVAGCISEGMFDGNKLSFSKNGACCDVFYQDKPFSATSDVLAFTLKKYKLNKYIAIFLKVIIEQEKTKFSYARKPSVTRLNNVSIKLPSKQNPNGEYEPDWEYMENYIKSLPYSSAL